MKLFFVRSGLFIAMGAAGCALGSSVTDDDLRGDTAAVEPAPGAVVEGESAASAPDGGALVEGAHDGGTPSAGDAAVSDATVADAVVEDATAEGAIVAPGACAFAFSGTLTAFDFSAVAGTPAEVSPAASAAGLVVTPLKRVGVTAVSASGAMNASAWPTAGALAGKYFAFSVTAPPGCTLTFTALGIDLQASATGPKNASVGSSVDVFVAHDAVPVTTAGGAASVPVGGVVAAQGTVELRVYGSAASATGGTMRVRDVLTLAGTLN